MGQVIRAYRRHPHHGRRPLAQQDMARWLSITQGHLSRIENGHAPVNQLDTLITYARVLNIPRPLLWFDLPTGRAGTDPDAAPRHGDRSVLPPGLVAVITGSTDNDLAESMLTTLAGYCARDQVDGAHQVLDLVDHDLAGLRGRITTAGSGDGGRHLRTVASRYAEFRGWLHQDSGDLAAAEHWTRTALTDSTSLDEPALRAYVLMRLSNIAGDAGNLDAAADFIDEALTYAAILGPRQRAVQLRQRANVTAQRAARSGQHSDVRDCVDALARAADAAAEPVTAPDTLAGYCSPEYVSVEAAQCWIELGQPEKAVTILEPRLAQWHGGGRRDLGMGLARLATAYTGAGAWAEAIEAASYATTIVADTRSHRTLTQLLATETGLRAAGRTEEARELNHQLRTAYVPTPR